ncbi:hypothetical protein [Nocardia mangyaensis]|uniref:hypothetical protein n=1 Tax=Nocardia mangyaensis TaxID=2213200 RepID=UPI0012EB56D1|nr:hypothetical protein [Nocardia mangyaensis]
MEADNRWIAPQHWTIDVLSVIHHFTRTGNVNRAAQAVAALKSSIQKSLSPAYPSPESGISATTWGADWSNRSFPVRGSPDLRADLRAGAESIATAMAAALPQRRSRAGDPACRHPFAVGGTRTAPRVLWTMQ